MSILPSLPAQPPIDYSSRDYASVTQDLITNIPNFLPEWTDRSPGDFGIVMIELFAYMCDILNYYIDRVANEAFLSTAQQRQSVLNIANMLDYPFSGPQAAAASLQFTIPAGFGGNYQGPVKIPIGTTVSTQQVNPQTSAVSFQTNQDLWIFGDNTTYPYVDRFSSSGLASQQYVLTHQFLQATSENLSATSQLTVTVAGVTWTKVASFAGQLNTAQVYTLTSANTTILLNNIVTPVTVYTITFGNGTNGAIPAAAAAIVASYSPFVGAQYTGSVVATQGTQVTETLGSSSGLPNQNFFLFQSPVIDGSVLITVDQGDGRGPISWSPIARLIDAANTIQAYTTVLDASGAVQVQFGDNVNGIIPIPGAVIVATYRVGGGVTGNVLANTLNVLSKFPAALPVGTTVTNPLAATGGADAETVDHIRSHAPLAIKAGIAQLSRAVTAKDYAFLCMQLVSTVAKASAVATFVTAVTLYIHPSGGFATDPPNYTSLTSAVNLIAPSITNANSTGALDNRKMDQASIVILPPQYNADPVNNSVALKTGYVPVDIVMSVQVQPTFRQSVVQSQVQAAVASLLDFSQVDFGFRLPLSSVYQVAQAVQGVAWINVTKMCRDEQVVIVPPVINDIVCATYEIPILNLAQLSVTATGGINY